jgi:polyhydroxyalkanoic acid synthase PhaR subunit
MADEKAPNGKPFDPMDPWRGMRDAYMDVWAKTMVEAVNSEAYAQASGAILDSYLTASSPFREAVEKTMLKVLEQMSMPSRADFVSLAERMTNVEMRLDDMDAKLDRILQQVSQSAPATSRKSQSVVQQRNKTAKPAPKKKRTK